MTITQKSPGRRPSLAPHPQRDTNDAEALAAMERADPSLTPLLAAIVSRFAKTPPQRPDT